MDMTVVGWQVWYSTSEVYNSKTTRWEDLPDDNVQFVKMYFKERKIPFLGRIPLSKELRECSDHGHPIAISNPQSPTAKIFEEIASALIDQLVSKDSGGSSSDRPEPVEIKLTKEEVHIQWSDKHQSIYAAFNLRFACHCAQCVDETTGKLLLTEARIRPDVHALSFEKIGNYAIRFRWSDGHSSGLYTYEHLRLCDGATAKVNQEEVRHGGK